MEIGVRPSPALAQRSNRRRAACVAARLRAWWTARSGMPGAGKKKKKKKGKAAEKGGAVGAVARGAEAKVSAAGTATTSSAAATSLTRTTATFSRIPAGSALLKVEPHDFLIFNAYIPTFNGYYHYSVRAPAGCLLSCVLPLVRRAERALLT